MSNLQVAETIRQQLGGNRFSTMTGAASFAGSADTLSFRIPQARGVRGVRITLDANDTYTMVFLGIRKFTVTEKARFSGVYGDQLQEIFTKVTGLDTKL